MHDIYYFWIGALCVGVVLLAMTLAVGFALYYAVKWAADSLLQATRMTTARYWVLRMEREGLTVPMREYRRMVAERNAKTLDDFGRIDEEWERSQQ